MVKLLILAIFTLFWLTGCTMYTTYPNRAYISTGYGYTYYPRTYYSYQAYPYYNAYYPYGYPYYVNRPIYWQRNTWMGSGYHHYTVQRYTIRRTY